MTSFSILKNNTTKVLGFSVFLLLSVFITQDIFAQKASAAYDGGKLIDNGVFLDATSMNASQIQSFLASKGGQLANRSFVINCDAAGQQAKQVYVSLGAPCNQSIPASQIIYYSAQVYGLNPKTILATLQKEQSLVTATNPTDRQYAQAMGYACPTSGSCDTSSNFFWQIDNGTWVLRFHYERARGNMNWWYTSSSWTCGTEKQYYKPNLYPNQNVNFHDQDNVHYRTHYIATAATSSLYCYTPHAYNNPQGLYGLPAFGHTGRYYTGSYNFVKFFELWFGTTLTPSFTAQTRAQSAYPTVKTEESVDVYVQFTNTGSAFWKDDVSTFPGYHAIRLAATNPINRDSSFASPGWFKPARPNNTFTKVLEADGYTQAADQHTVHPGQIAEFRFTLTVPYNMAPGVYREYFQPILEGAPGWSLGTWAYFDITVVRSEHRAVVHSQSSYPSLVAGENTANTFFMFKNTGNTVWYDDASVPAGKRPVHLATTWPINRPTNFDHNWVLNTRPNALFSAVYEADGVTLASNQHVVNPGQIAKYNVAWRAPAWMPTGFYQEYLEPIVEGAPGDTWSMRAPAWMGLHVTGQQNKGQFHSQSTFPTITAGGAPANAHFTFKNTGNTVWYDDASVPAGKRPVHLATSLPINRSSKLNYGWVTINRPNALFSAVYEADGVTLASNQHVVNPGQIARFNFSFWAPPGTPPGFYKEFFEPIIEGAPNLEWRLGVDGVYLGVTVQ